MTTYAVTGATGPFGRLAIESLLGAGITPTDVVAIARTPAKLKELAARGVSVRAAEYDEPDTLRQALAGVDRLLFVSGSELGRRITQHGNVIDAARTAGVTRIVYTSMLRADTSTNALVPEHRATEQLLRESGLAYTALRNGWYIENFTEQLPQYLEHGEIVAAAGDGRISAATRADYAAAAVVILTGEQHGETAYELGGAPFTLGDFASQVTEITGTKVEYRSVTAAQMADVLESEGLNRAAAENYADVYEGVARGDVHTDSDDLSRLIGRPATSLAAVIRASIPVTGNAEVVLAAMHALFNEQDVSVLERLYAPDFKQHHPTSPDGHDALAAAVTSLPPGRHHEVATVVCEGDIVMVHGRYVGIPAAVSTPGLEGADVAPPIAGVDIFRVVDGRIAEHWDVLQPEVPAEDTVSGRPMITTT